MQFVSGLGGFGYTQEDRDRAQEDRDRAQKDRLMANARHSNFLIRRSNACCQTRNAVLTPLQVGGYLGLLMKCCQAKHGSERIRSDICLVLRTSRFMILVIPPYGQCEVEGGPVPVGALPAMIGDDAPNNVFPATAGDLDDLRTADVDR